MVRTKKRNGKTRETKWIKTGLWPHEYAQQIIEGKTQLQAIPAHLRSLVSQHLKITKHADERLAVKYGAQIALMKTLRERRQALANVPEKLRARTEYHARQIFERLRKERQQT